MKTALPLAAVVLVRLAVAPALAQDAGPCVERSDFLDHLSLRYGEAPVAMGVTASGGVLEVVASETGSWTIIVTWPSGVSCGLASGESWETFVPRPPEEPA